jgi:hypothetical protein
LSTNPAFRFIYRFGSPLCWRKYYLLPMGVFPLLASAAQITIVFKFDAVNPTDDFHCDASNPIWCVEYVVFMMTLIIK